MATMTRPSGPTGPLSGVLPARRLALAVLSMAVGAFAIGVTEFATMGLLPQIAETFDAPLHQASHLIAAYAVGVVVGAPAIMLALPRQPRTGLLIGLAGALALGNAFSALAPTLGTELVSRVLAGLPHGAYFGLTAVVAAAISPPQRRARSVSLVMVGLTVATMVGVPLSTALGQQLGWRAMYGLVTVIALVSMVAIWQWVPPVPARQGASTRRELTALTSPQVWLAVGIGGIGFGGMFALYSFIAPVSTEAGVSPAHLPLVLALFGAGMTVGTVLGGRLADRSVLGAIAVGMGAMAVALAAFGAWARQPTTLLVLALLVGIASGPIGPGLQIRLIDAARQGPSLGAALHHSAMNTGNAVGAWLGGAVVAAGLGYHAPAWAGVGLALAGLAITGVAAAAERRTTRRAVGAG